MTQLQTNIDDMVKKIKTYGSLSDICFVKGFGAYEQANPLSDYMIAVSTLDTQVVSSFVGENVKDNLKGGMYDLTLKFRIYAPKNNGGEGLISLANELCDAIRKSDSYNACQDIKISAISFDENAMSVYRDVVLQLSFCMYEEVTG
ncbi:MAG: hypothetical protein IJD68_08120 [Ruminococcus sp.]|nr:hypothetical protein [Ruminococcus sp.]